MDKRGHGGQRPGAGRPLLPTGERTISKSITLMREEWIALAEAAVDGSPTKEAARRLRASLQAEELGCDKKNAPR